MLKNIITGIEINLLTRGHKIFFARYYKKLFICIHENDILTLINE